ncbi:hypothetical protein CDAR_498811 [Caerostris darwini]|uniref:Uncharacterized protein n=1 Tax=Caerostris darwini TaxID=1538125 RepID=A0AAV4SS98_9ARAC|nr:hypothetical protein CDAR_498811 [Caerostris darwini]
MYSKLSFVWTNRWPSLQSVHWPRRRADGEEEAAPNPNHLHELAAQGAGEGLPGDALPGHLHQGGDCHEDRPHGSQGAGACPFYALRIPTLLLHFQPGRKEN